MSKQTEIKKYDKEEDWFHPYIYTHTYTLT